MVRSRSYVPAEQIRENVLRPGDAPDPFALKQSEREDTVSTGKPYTRLDGEGKSPHERAKTRLRAIWRKLLSDQWYSGPNRKIVECR